ncbi:chitinase, partial [Vibrio vulnificus]
MEGLMKKTLITAALLSTFAGSVMAQEKVVAGYFADWQYANASNPYTVKD